MKQPNNLFIKNNHRSEPIIFQKIIKVENKKMDESEIQTAMKLKVATQLLADSERKNEELDEQVDQLKWQNEELKREVEQLKCNVDHLQALVDGSPQENNLAIKILQSEWYFLNTQSFSGLPNDEQSIAASIQCRFCRTFQISR